MTGYSGTPLAQKLGLTGLGADARQAVLHAPAHYAQLLPEFAGDMALASGSQYDWLQAFYSDEAVLAAEFPHLMASLVPAGQLWISWPKQSSALHTGLNENTVRDIGLRNGLVDVKVAAVDEDWSGLKFVRRLVDRA